MSVDVDKTIHKFLNRINDKYNSEVYFLETCYKFPDKYSALISLTDLSLQIFFEQNNKIDLCGEIVTYCKKGTNRTIKLMDITDDVNQAEFNVVKNYIIERDVWEKSQF